ncbi:MAG TPA: DOMON-like domain-containing protein [Steroidobacteraceae bacterium]|jgi:hypothetical protein|nr:DOMON-like domain-containing protein [Steroidobacteraceae bacterium]
MVTGLNPSALVVAQDAQRSVLLAHPDSACPAVSAILVEARLAAPAQLSCHYALQGDIGRVRLSDSPRATRTDGLWRHTCFEVFVATSTAGYYEFNFSPALAWAAYRFEDYRHGMTPARLARAPRLRVQQSPAGLELAATLDLAGLADLAAAARLHLALAAVIEDQGGRLAYWALRHAPGVPDFHHRDGFTLELRAP